MAAWQRSMEAQGVVLLSDQDDEPIDDEEAPEAASTKTPTNSQDRESGAPGAEEPPHPDGAAASGAMEGGTGSGHNTERVSEGTSHRPRKAGKVGSCRWCRRTNEMMKGGKLRECTGCGTVWYCGSACQVADWAEHKAACKDLQKASQA
jgi:hypothetical protein